MRKARTIAVVLMKVLALTVLCAGFATHASADTVWNLNASFTYNSLNNTATGTFQLDPSLNIVTWNITVTGTNTAANDVYTPVNSLAIYPDLTHLDFYDFNTNQYINLYFASALSSGGGPITLLAGDGGATNNSTIVCNGCGILSSGYVTTENGNGNGTAVPEPSSLMLIGCGALGFVGVLRRKLLA